MIVFQGENPSALQVEILNELMSKGEEVTPRGKKIKEIRPASVEFLNPLKRVTFLRGRRINPFFQLAESLWILSGRSDVGFLELFNKNMKSFSDDGISFNASYGERIRSYGKNDLHQVIYNPIDQLTDCYVKLTADKDTRQAVIVISNPHFDNAKYTIGEKGKDIACNLVITFKLRDSKLNMTVFNRSNDVIWGLFGANIVQFSTLQELLASWLKVGVGSYHHVTDSLHLYLDDYASAGNAEIFKEHIGLEKGEFNIWDMIDCKESIWWNFESEPHMSMSKELTELFFEFFWSNIVMKLADDDFVKTKTFDLLKVLYDESEYLDLTDEYWRMSISAMFAYRFIRLKQYDSALKVIHQYIPNSSWKVSMMYFLKEIFQKNLEVYKSNGVQDWYIKICDDLISSCLNDKDELELYLNF